MAAPSPDFPVPLLAKRIFEIAEHHNSAARIVGGAVRDWLMGRTIGDIDMAIAMPIETAAAAFIANGLRVIETGLAHGTVTVMMPEKTGQQSIEVTQTRIDVETDGRHARIAFSTDWAQDAARRDLTINAIYLTADGQIDDPLNGQADIAAGRLRFAGDAGERVREDALRMLRYCRFLSLFAAIDKRPDANSKDHPHIDQDAREALEVHAELAANLSGERVQSEMKKICRGANPMAALRLMQNSGVARAAIGVDLAPALLAFLPPYAALAQRTLPAGQTNEGDDDDLWLVFLHAVIPNGAANLVADRLRLSRKEARLLGQLDADWAADSPKSPREIAGENWRRAAWKLRRAGVNPGYYYLTAMAHDQQMADLDHAHNLSHWQATPCPVGGEDLLSQGVDKGPALGQMLAIIEARWVASDFTLTKAELLQHNEAQGGA